MRPPSFIEFCEGLNELFQELERHGIHNSRELAERFEQIKAEREAYGRGGPRHREIKAERASQSAQTPDEPDLPTCICTSTTGITTPPICPVHGLSWQDRETALRKQISDLKQRIKGLHEAGRTLAKASDEHFYQARKAQEELGDCRENLAQVRQELGDWMEAGAKAGFTFSVGRRQYVVEHDPETAKKLKDLGES